MPKHLFFDLDHTIWDFDANAEDTLIELYDHYGLSKHTSSNADHFVQVYKEINDSLWAKYRQNLISKDELRTTRFELSFQAIGIQDKLIPSGIWEQYIEICPTKTKLLPGALSTLDHLAKNYQLHLITNGFAETQRRKLHHSKLDHFFSTLTISEEVGAKKPDPKIFQHALKTSGSTSKKGIYVGDNFEADVQGGLNLNWQVFWLKSDSDKQKLNHPKLTTIRRLNELITHL